MRQTRSIVSKYPYILLGSRQISLGKLSRDWPWSDSEAVLEGLGPLAAVEGQTQTEIAVMLVKSLPTPP